MKTKLAIVLTITSILMAFNNCSPGKASKGGLDQSSQSSPTDNGGGGGGAGVPGVGALSVPTGDALVKRITNGLESNVNPASGNFAKSLTQVAGNLPKTTDPTKATGFDQAQLLIYAACSDLTTGTTPLMQSKYNVTKAGTIATNQTNLINAGVRMLDQYTAGLASQGPTAADVTKAFTDLVSTISTQSGSTSTIAFMSVCIAANTAGSSMMGF